MSQEAVPRPRGAPFRTLPPFWKKAGGKLFVAVSHRQEKDFRFFLSEGEGCYGRQAGSFLLASIVAKKSSLVLSFRRRGLLRAASWFISSGFNRCQGKALWFFLYRRRRLLRAASWFISSGVNRCQGKVLCFFLSRKKREPDRAKRRKGRPLDGLSSFLSILVTRCAGPPRGLFWRRCGRG